MLLHRQLCQTHDPARDQCTFDEDVKRLLALASFVGAGCDLGCGIITVDACLSRRSTSISDACAFLSNSGEERVVAGSFGP